MTCDEFRAHISDAKLSLDADASEHLEGCAGCRAMAHAEDELSRCFAMARDSAPKVPASLDASVMAAYRQRKVAVADRHRLLKPLAWSALAAGLMLAAILLVSHRGSRAPVPDNASRTTEPPRVTQPALPLPERAAAKAEPPARPKVARAHVQAHRNEPKAAPAEVAERRAPSNGFQNLMYCDPLSCGGAMQVIRIQVPAGAIDQVPAWRPSNGMVQADVVVGSDGIARAIRIVR